MNPGDRLQWCKGDYYSQIETVKEFNEEHEKIIFESGRSVYSAVVLEFMIPLEPGVAYIIEPQNSNNKSILEFPNPNMQIVIPEVIVNPNINSILNIFKKSSEKSTELVKLDLLLTGLPTLDVIKMMYTIYEVEEADEALVKYLESNIQQILEQVKDTLKK